MQLSYRMTPLEGAYIHGLYLEGAGWNCQINSIVSLHVKEQFFSMPVIHLKSIMHEKRNQHNMYHCPLYKTR